MNHKNFLTWCFDNGINEFEIFNGKINVYDHCWLNDIGLEILPYSFGIINGDFVISNNNLRSLKNFPLEINGSLYIMNNPQLKSLEGLCKVNGDIFTDLKNDPIYLKHVVYKKFLHG